MWIPIPLALATSLGLSTLALDLPVSEDEANQGLISVAAAQYLLGKSKVYISKTHSGKDYLDTMKRAMKMTMLTVCSCPVRSF